MFKIESEESEVPFEKIYWESVYGPQGPPNQEATRGTFHLHFSASDIDEIWEQIIKLTKNGDLGYITCKSPDAMTYGRWEGDYTISAHVIHDNRWKVWKTLKCSNLSSLMSYKKKAKIPFSDDWLITEETFEFMIYTD